MGKQIRLRAANKKDLDFIQELLRSNKLCFEDIPQKISSLFVAYEGSKVIGTVGVEKYGGVGLLRSTVIQESSRGQGYGEALVDGIIEKARAMGVKELYLLTTTAEGFFYKKGFRRINRELAPPAIRNTREFRELCSDTSVLMHRRIS